MLIVAYLRSEISRAQEFNEADELSIFQKFVDIKNTSLRYNGDKIRDLCVECGCCTLSVELLEYQTSYDQRGRNDNYQL